MSKLLIILAGLVALSQSKPAPPPLNQYARLARYMVHYSDYISIATISTMPGIEGFPFVSLASLSDGPPKNGTGVPYVYIPDIDITATDARKNNRITMLLTLAQGDYCLQNNYDPEDPRCARLMLTGNLVTVDNSSQEHEFAQNALFEKHPVMADWPADHGFHVAKLVIKQIALFSHFGGPTMLTNEEYFKVKPDELVISTDEFLDNLKLKLKDPEALQVL